jgi:hypothetical protein
MSEREYQHYELGFAFTATAAVDDAGSGSECTVCGKVNIYRLKVVLLTIDEVPQ